MYVSWVASCRDASRGKGIEQRLQGRDKRRQYLMFMRSSIIRLLLSIERSKAKWATYLTSESRPDMPSPSPLPHS